MEKLLLLLAIVGFIFFYYSKPVSVEQEKPVVQQEQKKKPVKPKPVEVQEEQIIEVQEETSTIKPLPQLSPVIQSTNRHPYSDPDKYPLHYAICKGNFDQVKQVLKKESLVNEQGEVVIGTKECYCPQNNYEVCTCNESVVMPPLNLAILKRDETIIKYLLKKKANPLIKDELGRNALDVAQQKNMANIQDLLAKYIK